MTTTNQLDQIVETATRMLTSGVLVKNVKRHFTNAGLDSVLTEKIVRIAEINANELQTLKSI